MRCSVLQRRHILNTVLYQINAIKLKRKMLHIMHLSVDWNTNTLEIIIIHFFGKIYTANLEKVKLPVFSPPCKPIYTVPVPM